MTVYLDLVMLINFVVDYFLLLGSDRLAGFPGDGKRAAWGALLGALYSGACLLPGFLFLGNILWRLVCLCLMANVAFGWNRSAWNRTGIFILLSMALGGVAAGIGHRTGPMLMAAAAGIWCLCRISCGGSFGRTYVPMAVRYGERQVEVVALRDTGNSLRDPITGEPVMVMGSDGAEKLLGLGESQLRDPMNAVMQDKGFRLIPYRAVGQPAGMLLGIRAEVLAEGKCCSRIVAFAPERIGRGQCYQALVC